MSAILARNTIMPGAFNNYVVAGNLCNAFTLGNVGSADDFFLVGAEPEDESSHPLLTGNILDSEGNLLCTLVRNVLRLNPGHCSKLVGDLVGYEIHDAAGTLVLGVRTVFEQPDGCPEPCWLTTLTGTFFDRDGRVAFRAHAGAGDEHLEAHGKGLFGFSGGAVGINLGLSEQEREVAISALTTGGALYRVVTGVVDGIDGQPFNLDGVALLGATIRNATIIVRTGRWYIRNDSTIENCEFRVEGEALRIAQLLSALNQGG